IARLGVLRPCALRGLVERGERRTRGYWNTLHLQELDEPAVGADLVIEAPDRFRTPRRCARRGDPFGLLSHAEERDIGARIAEETLQTVNAVRRRFIELASHRRRNFDAGFLVAAVREELGGELWIFRKSVLLPDAEEVRR